MVGWASRNRLFLLGQNNERSATYMIGAICFTNRSIVKVRIDTEKAFSQSLIRRLTFRMALCLEGFDFDFYKRSYTFDKIAV
jgi:hypothetical protein